MTAHRDMQRSGQAWLRGAFERTKLPRNGLADYLELDYASVSRMLTGHRLVDPHELALARGYFSIVPGRLASDALEAIGLLRSAKVRAFAASELLRWFSSEATKNSSAESFAGLIEDRTRKQTLRADQIVAICRVEALDLRPLASGYGVARYCWPETNGMAPAMDALSAIASSACEWAGAENLHAYDFDRGRRSRPAGARKTPSVHAVRVASVKSPTSEFGSCTALAVLGSNKLPLIPSREVYLAPLGTEMRYGDAVAVLRPDEAAALFGKLSLTTETKIVLELADGKLEEIPTGHGVELRRVAFCRV
jgi:hypothetical protein